MSKKDPRAGFKWWLWICALLLLPLLISLGCWQLQRATEKQQLLQDWNDGTLVLHRLEQLQDLGTRNLVRAHLEGDLLRNRWLLLDNRMRDGRAGYEVIALLQSDSANALLPVNLGWVQASPDRSRLPHIELPARAEFSGRLRRVEPAFMLTEDQWTESWPRRVQMIDIARLEQVMGRALLPWVLEVTEPVLSQLRVDRPLAQMQPTRHLGYAFQWFAMAAVLAGLLVWHWRRLRFRGLEYEE
ncbi:SURF1 family protein [Marinobacterium aestuariivivens]|uniref:SURF1-like protein n=1 Tax=Marinobacterium aestuariivivens TaxID=1698799 RepID=A0ABW2A0R5_9GAMM